MQKHRAALVAALAGAWLVAPCDVWAAAQEMATRGALVWICAPWSRGSASHGRSQLIERGAAQGPIASRPNPTAYTVPSESMATEVAAPP